MLKANGKPNIRRYGILLAAVILLSVTALAALVRADTSYIYFDLDAGNITILWNQTNGRYEYKGYVYDADGNAKSVTGEHLAANRYYVYQSVGTDKIKHPAEGEFALSENYEKYYLNPDVIDQINVETDVEKAIALWAAAAKVTEGGERTSTENRIRIATDIAVDMVLDNIWSTYQGGGNGAEDGGIAVNGDSYIVTETDGEGNETKTTVSILADVTLRLKGDNRLGALRYWTANTYDNAKHSRLAFTSFAGDKENSGSLTVIGDQTGTLKNSPSYGQYYYKGINGDYKVPRNHWTSAIGANDSEDHAVGYEFRGGTVYAGTTKWENSTAIGGGGNGNTIVQISGGRVTAVSSSTGCAIGGGIAHTSYGGKATVEISGGNVRAYNFGQPFGETLTQEALNQLGDAKVGENGKDTFVPGTAIGGGSSAHQYGNVGNVTITGGTVYAESTGGAGIGGGNTIKGTGGIATVTISGGNVTAKSTAGLYTTPGSAIGGGSSYFSTGGEATVTISGGQIDASGIGGGGSTVENGGDATIDISGGTTLADSVGGGFSVAKGYARGYATITGGSLNAMLAAVPYDRDAKTEDDARQVFMTRGEVSEGNAILPHVRVTDIVVTTPEGEHLPYRLEDVYTDEKGYLYFWLPNGYSLYSVTVDETGEGQSATYSANEADMKIDCKDIGMLTKTPTADRYSLHLTTSEFYTLYSDSSLQTSIEDTLFLPKGTMYSYYMAVGQDTNGAYYDVHSYIAVEDAGGNKIFRRLETLLDVDGEDGGIKTESHRIERDLQVWFEVTGTDDTHYFTIDLRNGNVNVTTDPSGGVVIEQDGYRLSGFSGDIYLTSGGVPSDNRITFDCADRQLGCYLDRINACREGTVIDVVAGDVELSFSEADNIVSSSIGAPIRIAETATVHLTSEPGHSLKLDAVGDSAVSGAGHLDMYDGDGFLKIKEMSPASDPSPDFSVGAYTYHGDSPDFTAHLYSGYFRYELIGYLDENGNLKVPSEMKEGNTESFSARAVRVSLQYVNESGMQVKDGKLLLTLTPESGYEIGSNVEILDPSGNPISGDDWSFDEQSGVLTLEGAAFANSNLFILAGAAGVIPYEAGDTVYVYDGASHTIAIMFDTSRFVAYYSTEQALNGENYLQGSTVCPLFTDVNVNTVYWYIKKITDDGYTPIAGSNTVTIKPAVNEWIIQISCSDVAYGKLPRPSATARWQKANEPTFTYYYDAEGTHPIEAGALSTLVADEYYYVRASVSGMLGAYGQMNYDTIESEIIRFRVFETKIFTELDRVFVPADDPEISLYVAKNGAFTVYYQMEGIEGMALGLSVPLRIGTKLTMISFDESDRPTFYYYVISSENVTSIPLVSFIRMGTTSPYLQAYGRVRLQFCFDFDDLFVPCENDTTELNVTMGEMPTVTVKPSSANRAEWKTEPTVTVNGTQADITLHPIMTGSGEKILAIRSDIISPNMEMRIYRPGQSAAITPTDRYGDLFLFRLGTDSGSVDGVYTLQIRNPGVQRYTLSCDVRVLSEVKTPGGDPFYSLAGEYAAGDTVRGYFNHAEVTIETELESDATRLYVEYLSNQDEANPDMGSDPNADRVLAMGERHLLRFRVITDAASVSDLQAELQRKDQGNYFSYGELALTPIESEEAGWQAEVLLDTSNLRSGTYRIAFRLGEASCHYSIIIAQS